MILQTMLLSLLLQTDVPAASAEQACRPAIVAEATPEAIHFIDGDVFLPDTPSDALEVIPGDIVFACEDHLREIENLFLISGQWANREM